MRSAHGVLRGAVRSFPAAVAFLLATCLAAASWGTPETAHAQTGLAFDGVNDHVTFGAAPSLGLSTFTLELWFRREGPGATASTGTGGITAVPLLTKGRGEADGDVRDMNYFLGIRGTDSLLVGDFEEGTGQASPGLNHPIVGVTPIRSHVWYHAALTHDGTMWRLYLDGRLEAEIAVGRLPQAASTQHAALATAMTSTGVTAGFFHGRIDEVRIWDHAREGQAIRDSLGLEIASAPGLAGRWGLDEGAGMTANNSIGGGVNGSLVNGTTWVAGSSFALPQALLFGGTNAYVTFGPAPGLGLASFTVETWFRRDGAGIAASTGTGGVVAVPLVTKGTAEAEASNVDMNWYLGIRGSDGVLAADFEEGTGQPSPGLNHPVVGKTPITSGVWHHAAATYDGTMWRLYLDGLPETTLVVGRLPQSASIQHGALGSALNSTGVAGGFFLGRLDETRVWSYARSEAEIQAAINTQIVAPTSGLVARWGYEEAAGIAVAGSAGTSIDGTVTGANFGWADGSTFDLVIAQDPPEPPTDLTASALGPGTVELAWIDASTNESGFEIERSLAGSGGPFDPLATVVPNATGYLDATAPPESEVCYRVRAANGAGESAWAGPACATTPAAPNQALDLAGTDAYVTFGPAPALGLAQFTLEAWFRRDGPGVTTTTGTGGVTDAIPILTKGRGESEGGNVDMNWFLGLRGADGVLVADFEEGTGQPSPGLNHPIAGTTPVSTGTWHHAAATFDGTTWRLYLDGLPEGTLAVGRLPQSSSIQHAALGSALNSTGVAAGFFDGVIDEARVWNVARTQSEIRATANQAITATQSGLVARWGLDEVSGTAVLGSAGTTTNGSIQGAAWARVPGAPFDLVFADPPDPPALVGPPDGGSGVPTAPALEVSVSDPESAPLTVTFHGRPAATQAPGPDFTVIGLPDTQYYTSELNGGSNALFKAQTGWVVEQLAARNIAYAVQLGDCTEHGQNGGDPIQWMRADSALAILEDPATTQLQDGLPYGVCVGNHDQTPNGDAAGSTEFYNQYFGEARFAGRAYYGGHFGTLNDNWFDLFEAGGLSFLVIGFEYDTSPDAAVLTWADSLCSAYPARRVIVASHSIVGTGNPASFSAQGQAIYQALKDRPNVFLMLCGHAPGEGRRSDVFEGRTVHTLLSDYQSRTRGGDGWLRIVEFSPAQNVLRVRTYSPSRGEFEADSDSSSQFTLPCDLTANAEFEVIGTLSNVTSGSTASLPWPGRAGGTAYEWYVTVSDGVNTTTGPLWSFTTGAVTHALSVTIVGQGGVIRTPDQPSYAEGTPVTLEAVPDPGWSFAGWSGDAGGSENPIVVTMDGEKAITATFTPITGTDPDPVVMFGLPAVGPSPARGPVRIVYDVPRLATIRLAVYDVLGREVALLVEGEVPAGRHTIEWDARAGRRDVRVGAAPGIYFVAFDSPGGRFVRRVVRID